MLGILGAKKLAGQTGSAGWEGGISGVGSCDVDGGGVEVGVRAVQGGAWL